ncbi:unnamed protein product, partial [Mycena citricolor]
KCHQRRFLPQSTPVEENGISPYITCHKPKSGPDVHTHPLHASITAHCTGIHCFWSAMSLKYLSKAFHRFWGAEMRCK